MTLTGQKAMGEGLTAMETQRTVILIVQYATSAVGHWSAMLVKVLML